MKAGLLMWALTICLAQAQDGATNPAPAAPKPLIDQPIFLDLSRERLDEILRRREVLVPPTDTTNRVVRGRTEYRGLLVQLQRHSFNPLQLLNPFAPTTVRPEIPVPHLPWAARVTPPLPWSFMDERFHEPNLIIFSVGR